MTASLGASFHQEHILNVYDRAAWGSDSTTIFASNTRCPAATYTSSSINQNGPTLSNTLTGALSGFAKRPKPSDKTTGRLYDASGDAIDATTGSSAGQYQCGGGRSGFAIDPITVKHSSSERIRLLLDRLIIFGSDIQAFDCNTYSYVNAIDIPSFSGRSWFGGGRRGLAVGGGSQILYYRWLLCIRPTGVTSPVAAISPNLPTLTSISPQTVQAGSGDTVVTLTGQKLQPGSGRRVERPDDSFHMAEQHPGYGDILLRDDPNPCRRPCISPMAREQRNSMARHSRYFPIWAPNTLIAAMNVSGEDMVWDPARSLLYVAVTNPAVSNGNSIAVVDPAAAALRNVVYTGNQPASLGISNDGTYLYSGFQTLASVKRFALPGILTESDNSAELPASPGESYAGDVKVAPGQNQTIAVSMGTRTPHRATPAAWPSSTMRPSGPKRWHTAMGMYSSSRGARMRPGSTANLILKERHRPLRC